MLRKLLFALAALCCASSFFMTSNAYALEDVIPCTRPTVTSPNCVPVTPTSPLPVVGSPSGSSYTWVNDIKATTSIVTATSVSTLINAAATYCVFQSISGTTYGTYDGSTPSSSNYDISFSASTYYPISGTSSLSALKLQGTNLAGNCWK